MKLEFKTKLKGDDIYIPFDLKPNQQIISKECNIRWHINPQTEEWGVRYWRAIMDAFECTITIQNIGEEKPEKIVIDGVKSYNMEMDLEEYRMGMDFCITKIEINRSKQTAIAGIQWTV